jgi:negative regulator of genetic competence, sporulation and motility
VELIRISEGKLKIALTKAELEAYAITANGIDMAKAETRSVFRELFVRAKENTGFDVEEDKVFVQIYTSKDGGCEIFVTRIEPEKRQSGVKTQKYTFSFDNVSTLIAACMRLKNLGYRGRSDAYSYNGDYILVLHSLSKTAGACLCEFGEKNENYQSGYINERMTLIRRNDAVKILAQL